MSTTAGPVSFDICGPLPQGVTVLEASAGTGKTYAIAALATRYVAEGVPLDRILLVTFTRMATGELRERVRERLVTAERGLDDALAGVPAGESDAVVRLLAAGSPDEVRTRRDNIARAVADFDSATIATTHGFCEEVLSGLGVAGDVEPDYVFIEDPRDLVEEVVDDLYIRKFRRGGRPEFNRAQAMEIAHEVTGNPLVPIVPDPSPGDASPLVRSRYAHVVRDEFERRKRLGSLMTYDDLLTRLHNTLRDAGGPAAAERLRERYKVVLVDEFQDTDPVQWDIMRRAFGHGDTTLVLIGDPKQAIYAFRGADVYAYLDAAGAAAVHRTLDVNWRSDQGLIDAYDAVFRGARLGHPEIVYRDVRACAGHEEPRLSGAPESAPLRLRVVHRGDGQVALTGKAFARKDSATEFVAADVAADITALLESRAKLEDRSGTGEPEEVRPGHIAVLVRTNKTAAQVRSALEAAGVPAVISGAGSVFGTESARDWLRLLQAIERPTAAARARAASLTPFLGWTAEQVAAAHDDEWEGVHRRLHSWARVLRLRGVASLTETITLSENLPARVLREVDGERRLTDLRHIGQLLHGQATAGDVGATALTTWLHQRIDEAASDTDDEERSRRLESDAEAVQVLTIHRSKGLEFPIVYFPYLWDVPQMPRRPVPVAFHDPDDDDRRKIDVGLQGRDYSVHRKLHEAEQRGEDLRLAYVALTRARHQAVVWWAPTFQSRESSLGRLLFANDGSGDVQDQLDQPPDDDDAIARLQSLAAGVSGCISVERARPRGPAYWSPPLDGGGTLDVSSFDRRLDWGWRRTSYSDITAGAHEARVGSEPEEPVPADEPDDAAPAVAVAAPGDLLLAVPSPLAAMPVGAQVGTFVHGVFEAVDFAAPDLDAELAARADAELSRRPVDVGDLGSTLAGLRAAIETPLGPLAGGRRLRDLAQADRLDELTFELPLAGGDEPSGRFTLSALREVLAGGTPDGDPVRTYVERLDDPSLRRDIRGYLTGSIDLVMRLAGDDGSPSFAIVDYKTNWLAPPGEDLTAGHHGPAALAEEMERRHYWLQALLYTVALHRYLRWRLPGYSPERNLAGVLYLFVRGMVGPDTPLADGVPCGVFGWRPEGALVEALSDVLDGRDAA